MLLCEQDKKVTKSYNFTSMSALPCGCERKKSPKTRDTKSKLLLLSLFRSQKLSLLTRKRKKHTLSESLLICGRYSGSPPYGHHVNTAALVLRPPYSVRNKSSHGFYSKNLTNPFNTTTPLILPEFFGPLWPKVYPWYDFIY